MCEKASLAHTGGEEVGEEGDSFPFRDSLSEQRGSLLGTIGGIMAGIASSIVVFRNKEARAWTIRLSVQTPSRRNIRRQ